MYHYSPPRIINLCTTQIGIHRLVSIKSFRNEGHFENPVIYRKKYRKKVIFSLNFSFFVPDFVTGTGAGDPVFATQIFNA